MPQTFIAGHDLGTDALDLTEEGFLKLASEHRGVVKFWLMNQEDIAGIGNIYSDEVLFQAGIHPRRSISELDEDAMKQLYKVMHSVLESAINSHADPDQMPSTFLLPLRKQDGRCPKCDTPLDTVKAAGRTAWYCPRYQVV